MGETKDMINFNVPPHIGSEEKYIAEAIANHKICGDGPFCKKCAQWFEEKTGLHHVRMQQRWQLFYQK